MPSLSFQEIVARHIALTKLVVGDLWHAVNPYSEKDIYEKMDVMETEMNAVAPNDAEAFDVALARHAVRVVGRVSIK